ncbi:MAG: hypothetical protein KDJ54_12175 [Candidatus Competibacteraceae bacterium]|nr:hypothetical protein [Candidatus Competibacteraceae bacterium]
MEHKSYVLISKNRGQRISIMSLILGVVCSFLFVYVYESIWRNGEVKYIHLAITMATYWLVYIVLSWLHTLSNNKFMVEIYINNEMLIIKNKESILWSKEIKKISSIEIEKAKGFFSFVSRAMLLRCNDGDSYYIPLDNLEFAKQSDEQAFLNSISNKA